MVVPSLMQAAPGRVRPGLRIYAVGDVHGCADRLAEMHAQIAADLAAYPTQEALLVHLGDFVDRGPDSAGVIAQLASGSPLPGVPMVALRGNHEQMMLDAMQGDMDALSHWRSNGGDAALQSWGIKRPKKGKDWPSELPTAHRNFLLALGLSHRVDGYLFVHAGVRPGVKLTDQSAQDLLWIRRAFLDSAGPLLPDAPDLIVVHGHTPEPMPEITATRIGIDTGAVRGGVLTCAVLQGNGVRFLVN